MKRAKVKVGRLIVCLMVLFAVGGAFQDVLFASSVKELIGETWTPPLSLPAAEIGPNYIKEFEKVTGGAIKFKWHTGSPFGPPAELYNRLVQGLIDFGQFTAGYTPGLFPFTVMCELPIYFVSEESLTEAIIDLYRKGYFDKEYGEIKVFALYSIGPYQLWTNKKLTKVSDLKGQRIRCPSPVFVEATKALGGVPVSLPASEIFTALEKGIIDATWACGNMGTAFKLADICKYVIMTNIGTTTQTWAFNKKVYEKLPDSFKKYIEANFEKFSLMGAQIFREGNEGKLGFGYAREKGVEMIFWSEEEIKKMKEMLSPVFKNWVEENEKKKLPAKKALVELYYSLEKRGRKVPFILPH